MSNSSEVLAALGEENPNKTFCNAGQKVEQVVKPDKVLGMLWRTAELLTGRRLPTKRELLRVLMSIFDPIGLLSFYTIQMKILMQYRLIVILHNTNEDPYAKRLETRYWVGRSNS